METPTLQPADGLKPLRNLPDFSIVSGGPLFRFLRRLQPSDDKLTSLARGVIIIPLLAWLPLLVLSAVGGQLFSGSVAVPFLPDLEVHIRFLLALPMLLIAELAVEQRLRSVPQEFLERNLIPENSATRFEAAVKSTSRLCTSALAEVLLVAFVYGVGILVIWRQYLALDTAAWYVTPSAEGSKALARWNMVWLRKRADFPVSVVPLVFPIVHLGALFVAGVAYQIELGS